MQQMKRLVAVLHGHVRFLRDKPGFPESEYRTDAGDTTCSWRLGILNVSIPGPYPNLPWKSPFNQAQDSDDNRRLFTVKSRLRPSPFTQVFAVVGAGTAFTEYEVGKGLESSEAEPDAILLMDCTNNLIHWMEPGDIEVRPLLYDHNVTGMGDLIPNYPEGFLVAFVDGAVWWIRKDVPHNVIAPFYTIEGARLHDRDTELSSYALDKIPPLKKHDGRYGLEPPDQSE